MASASSNGRSIGTSTSTTASTSSEIADGERPHDAADRVAERHLPGPHWRREHVVDVAVEARLEDRRGVVGERGLDHPHRDQPGNDEHLVVHVAHLLDAPAEREPEHEDEEHRGDHRREHGLRPELRDAQGLALAEPDEARHDAMAFTYTSSSRSTPKCSRRPSAVSRAIRCPPRISAISSQSSSASSR